MNEKPVDLSTHTSYIANSALFIINILLNIIYIQHFISYSTYYDSTRNFLEQIMVLVKSELQTLKLTSNRH